MTKNLDLKNAIRRGQLSNKIQLETIQKWHVLYANIIQDDQQQKRNYT